MAGVVSAAVTVLFGLILLFLPRTSACALLRLQTVARPSGGDAAGRATMAGFYLGLGLCCILLAQPLLYMALGFSWLFTAFGRMVSMLSDRGNTLYNWISLVIELVLAALAARLLRSASCLIRLRQGLRRLRQNCPKTMSGQRVAV